MANGDLINVWGLANNVIPSGVGESTYRPIRVSQRGEAITQPLHGAKTFPVADEGS